MHAPLILVLLHALTSVSNLYAACIVDLFISTDDDAAFVAAGASSSSSCGRGRFAKDDDDDDDDSSALNGVVTAGRFLSSMVLSY